jgi:hypothetical protein
MDAEMSVIDEILAQPIGAQFLRADLHIHSFGASHDVKDAQMTAAAIIQAAAKEGLSLIAITDHNEISNTKAALDAAEGTSVTVIPGVELSTNQGHLLCYLPTLVALRRFHGKLSFAELGLQTSRCQHSLIECLNQLSALGGIGVLAHVDISSGFEAQVPGGSPHKADVLCHPALLGIELKNATSGISYSDSDTDADRARMGRERVSRLGLGARQTLARVLNSDAHTLSALGRNAASLRKVTRYKMDAPSFDGLRTALEDADARVRIEEQIPQSIPRVVGIHIDGGFLSGQVVRFSPNLNCIIGGRGTGKSTVFESIRCITGTDSDSKVVDSEVWPECLHLCWQDQAGQRHQLQRLKDFGLHNLDDDLNGPRGFAVDCFGQGEAARISLEAQSDPLALLRYLDRFVDFAEPLAAEEKARERLLELQTDIETAEGKVLLIPQHERQLAITRQQLAAMQKAEVKELIGLHRQLATERELRRQIVAKLQEARDGIDQGSPKARIEDIRAMAEPTDLSVGETECRAIVAGAKSFETTIGTAETQISSGFKGFEALVTAQIASWRTKDNAAQKKVDNKRRELEALNIQFDMSYIGKLTKDEASHQQSVTSLNTWKPRLKELKQQRALFLKERWAARERVAGLRDIFGRQASQTLRESLTDLQVTLKYTRNAYSPEAANQIIQAMGWRTNQQPRADWLVEHLTVPVLLQALNQADPQPILNIKTPEDVEVFKSEEAALILQRLSEPAVRFALERAMLYDLPRLTVSRAFSDGKGGKRVLVRDFVKLSLGQQQSVLLALILSSESNRPLIIDQPEDNLDGEFIYTTLVPVLRRAKERRQVIIVTHNPNVAVLGDAELIVVMKAKSDRGEITSRGSIDNPATRDAACAILEGAKEAFLRRAKIYGVRLRESDT